MANTCNDVPERTAQVAEAQAELSAEIAKRDRAKAEALRRGQVWEGSPAQINLDGKIAEKQADLAEAQADLAEAQADCAA